MLRSGRAGQGREDPPPALHQHLQRLHQLGRLQPLRLPRPGGKVQGRRVSFDRPPASQFRHWELPFVEWAERNGYALDYASTPTWNSTPSCSKHYKLVLSVGHDEYWSAPDARQPGEVHRRRRQRRVLQRQHLLLAGAQRGRRPGPGLLEAELFRDDPLYGAAGVTRRLSHAVEPPPRQAGRRTSSPASASSGAAITRATASSWTASGAYTAHRPDHWLFAGTGLKRGDAFGGKDTIVGYECDGCELEWKDGLPVPTHRDGTPESFAVLATCPARWHPDDCEWYERWEKGRTGNAVVGTYTRGGTVVTVGTTDWAHGLRGGDAAVERITRNVLDQLSK